MTYQLYHDDILKWAETYDGPPFHAVLCDPPYHLTEIVKRFGKEDSAHAQYGQDGAFARLSRGFMGESWDGGDIAFQASTWAAIARHMLPGAIGMAFGGSRTWHRIAVAIEDAGLIIHPTIFGWAYGSGMPKGTRIDTKIDARAGAKRRVVGQRKHRPKFDAAGFGYREKDNGYNSKDRESFDVTEPATELAEAWQGHRYNLQTLKPALEPIIVFQKPWEESQLDTIMEYGTGAWFVDGGRIGSEQVLINRWSDGAKPFGDGAGHPYQGHESSGRWPANFVLVCSPECRGGDHVADCPATLLDQQSGISESKRAVRVDLNTRPGYDGGWEPLATERGHTDSGGASRYFYCAQWAFEVLEQLADADPVKYCPKPATRERDAGLEGFDPATVGDGRPTPIDNQFQRGKITRLNVHPTVKPISLLHYWAKVLLPPVCYGPRRILVPFAGSGSEMIGACLAGWDEVVGVELTDKYIPIAEARLRHFAGWRPEDVERALAEWAAESEQEEEAAAEEPRQMTIPLPIDKEAA